MAVNRASSMVPLARLLPLAVLELQAGHVGHDSVDIAVLILWAQNVTLPHAVGPAGMRHIPADLSSIQLRQDMGHVQGLRTCEMLTGSSQSCLLVHDPLVVGERSFVGSPCPEDRRIAALPLQI